MPGEEAVMSEVSAQTVLLQGCLDRFRAGEAAAVDELFRHVSGRLERLTRKMLRGFPGVHRWAQTDDVLQNASLRLLRALQEVRPGTVREFFALSAQQIRRELIDLARHYFGPQGLGARHASKDGAGRSPAPGVEPIDPSADPARLIDWQEFHELIQQLPDEEREVVDLLFYQELPQAEAAALLGVSIRTVQRRWQSALLQLHDRLDISPESNP
jgi:RNA polymerase sigma-70 factor (ECF subfamily)